MMVESNQPLGPKKSMSKMLIASIIVAVVAIAAVAGAYVLLSNGGSTSDGANQNNNSGDNDQTGDYGNNGSNNNVPPSLLKNGDFMQYTTTTTSGGMEFPGTMRWELSNVTSTGYDVEITVNSIAGTMSYMTHGNTSDTLGVSPDGADFDKGVKIGMETLSTPFGNKQVEHWRQTNAVEGMTTVTDIYIGANSPVLYKLVTTSTGITDPSSSDVSTLVLDDTNIDAIRNGNG
jgi:hypothetical protein